MIRIIGALAFVLPAACASLDEEPPFDPSVDSRIGQEVDKFCHRYDAGPQAGALKIGDREAYVTGNPGELHILILTRGCESLSLSGGAPVFLDRTPSRRECRSIGESVEVIRAGAITETCRIAHIYEWDREQPNE